MISILKTIKRIVALETLKSKKLLSASQDDSREFITLIACICADRLCIPLALIYKNASHDLQDTWLDNFDHLKKLAYFANSDTG